MFGISLFEVAVTAVAVALIFGYLFLPPFYHDIVQYIFIAVFLFIIVRWFLRRQRTSGE
jgi:hypothetical protein